MRIPISDLIGAILALIGALVVASQSILVRKSTVDGSINKLVGTVLVVNTIFWTIVFFLGYYPQFELNVMSFIYFGLSGFFGFFLGYFLLFLSIKRIGASRTLPLIKTQVIVALLLSVLFLGESTTFYHLIGIGLVVFGAGLVSKEISNDKKSNISVNSDARTKIFNMLIPLMGGVCWGLNWFFTRMGLMQGTPIILGLAISSVGGLIGFIIWIAKSQRSLNFIKLRQTSFYWYFLIGLVCALAFYLNFLALSFSRIVVVNPIWQVAPLFVLLLSYIFLPQLEKITNKIIIGSIIIVLGTITVILFM